MYDFEYLVPFPYCIVSLGWFFVTVCAHSQCISYKAACISITVILFACGTAVEIHSLNLKEQGSYFLPKTDKKNPKAEPTNAVVG